MANVKEPEVKEQIDKDLANISTVDIGNKAKEVVLRTRREMGELRCLVEFMDRDMQDIFEVKRQILNHTLKDISFEHLWQLYKPGDVVYRSSSQENSNRYQAYRILHITGGRVCFDAGKKSALNPIRDRNWDSDSDNEERCRDVVRSSDAKMTGFLINCFYLDFDGIRIGPKPVRFAIRRYKGTRSVFSFTLHPGFLSLEHQVQEKLIQRGARFMEIAIGTHKKYSGATIREANETVKHYLNFVINES